MTSLTLIGLLRTIDVGDLISIQHSSDKRAFLVFVRKAVRGCSVARSDANFSEPAISAGLSGLLLRIAESSGGPTRSVDPGELFSLSVHPCMGLLAEVGV